MPDRLMLEREWVIGRPLGEGGFGKVFAASAADGSLPEAALKFVQKMPGAERELLLANLGHAQNVVPILESGETDSSWVLVMPLAETSLRTLIDEHPTPIDEDDVIVILIDIATALSSINGTIVHRDLKPDNVLHLQGARCLSDFGISRYADATTATNTSKGALSQPYAAPERWRMDHVTTAADVYSWGILAFELLNGTLPFHGNNPGEWQDQHLHAAVPPLLRGSTPLQSLVRESLSKSVQVRPTPNDLIRRLERLRKHPASDGLARSQRAQLAEATRQENAARVASVEITERARRRDLFEAAQAQWNEIREQLQSAVQEFAPSARCTSDNLGGLIIRLHDATLALGPVNQVGDKPWGQWSSVSLDVVASCAISLGVPPNYHECEGRSHSLWFCNRIPDLPYSWYEFAFMDSPTIARYRRTHTPFAFTPGEDAAKALVYGMMEFQLARTVERLIVGELDEFIDRWAGWLADGSSGNLFYPRQLPES